MMNIGIMESKAEMEYRKMTESYVPKKNEYQDKLDRIRKTLLFECMYNLFDRCIVYKYNDPINENIKKNLIENFINEQGGTENTIKSFKKNKNFLLCEYYRIINTYSDLMLESKRKKACKEEDDDTPIEIDPSPKDDFFDEIEKSDDIDYVSNIIQNRVSRSIDEFIRDNTMDKFKIQDIIQTTQDNINSYNTDDSNEEDIKESFEALAKQKLNDITEGNRPKTIFECMVYNIANSSYKDEKLKKIYTENDSLNVDSIVENTKIIYTFLEMLNTTKMVKINESYIQKVLNDLNK